MGKGSDNEGAEDDENRGLESVLKEQRQEILNRKRGFLTRSDREFLLGLKQYESDQSLINKNRDIRNRVESGFLDLQLLRNISDDEQDKIISEIDKGHLHESIAELVAFVYSGIGHNTNAIEQMVRSGLFKAERGSTKGYGESVVDVEVNIDVEPDFDVELIHQRFKRGYADDLTPEEIGVLVREGRLDPEDYEELHWNEDERPRYTPPEDRDHWYRSDETE